MPRRNIAIIAHVDHGKTTLVDALFQQAGTVKSHQQLAERAMDSNDLEKERGITILAKCTSVQYGETRINIVDTPGHADFGGEVERILSMVDGVILLVDAAEGPMPQTKFVTTKALKLGLRPIVVVNKVDRSDARPLEVYEECFDLFAALDANEDQLDFPVLYAVGREGWAAEDPDDRGGDLKPLFDLILSHIPEPQGDIDKPFRMLASLLDADPFLGRTLTGKVYDGTIRPNMTIKAMDHEGKQVESLRVTKLLSFDGLERKPVDVAYAGDIIAIAGVTAAGVANTLCDPSVTEPIPAQPVDPPTLAVTFGINDSPLAGRDGSKVQSRVIRDRLMKEAEGNVAIRITETADKDAFEVAGRGELQIGVLIETMRREGFELSISRPRVLFQTDEEGNRVEPIEEVVIDLDDEYAGVVVEKMAGRKGEMTDMRPSGEGRTRITFLAPARGLIGYHGEFLTDTRGTGIMNRVFHSFDKYRGPIQGRRNGVLISLETGKSVPYALWNLEERGTLFVGAGEDLYDGMVIGENARGNDLEVNPLKGKKLSNVRASGKDDAVTLTPPRIMSLEQAIAYIDDDELVEVTPNHIRIRKRYLDRHERKKNERRAAS
ncbi:translational GTPase TypA [Minwuia sp.]|uniref:translational GTPase TypA n=1 Tax=Minwuia sp. TaxID=2493630 RepID=UPI003A94AEFE